MDKAYFLHRVSPLPETPGRITGLNGALELTIRPLPSCYLVSAWADTLGIVRAALARHIQVPLPLQACSAAPGENGLLVHLEPLTYAILRSPPVQLGNDLACVTDQTHAFREIVLFGDNAAEFLTCNMPLDLRKSHFRIGDAASTAIHDMPVYLWREELTFHLLVQRSFARALWEIFAGSLQDFTPAFGRDIRVIESERR